MRYRMPMLVAMLLTVVACSAPGPLPSGATPGPGSSTAAGPGDEGDGATPSPTPFDVEAAEANLGDLISVRNEIACAGAPGADDLSAATAYWGRLADADSAFADGLAEMELPEELEDARSELLEILDATEENSRRLAEATTAEEYEAALADQDLESQLAASALFTEIRAGLDIDEEFGAC